MNSYKFKTLTPSQQMRNGIIWYQKPFYLYSSSQNYKNDKLATVVEGDPKAPFSTATTPMSWRGRNSFS